MNENQQAIINVMKKRIMKGANHFHIENYKKRLKQIWKNSDAMVNFINSVDINQLFKECEGVK